MIMMVACVRYGITDSLWDVLEVTVSHPVRHASHSDRSEALRFELIGFLFPRYYW